MDIVKSKFNDLNPDKDIKADTGFKTSISKDAYEKGKEIADDVNITTGIKEGEKETLRLG